MNEFSQIVSIIQSARNLALYTVNSELVNLYWQVGHYVSEKLDNASWGESTVVELTNFIKNRYPDIKGFDKKNIYRMCQFYQLYKDLPNVAPLVRYLHDAVNQLDANVAPVVRHLQEDEIPSVETDDIRKTILAKISWTHHLIIIGRCKSAEEREFYIRLSIKDRYSKRELDRQINSGVFERVMLGNALLSKNIKQLPQENPSIGILVCRGKDDEVVEYALNRSLRYC